MKKIFIIGLVLSLVLMLSAVALADRDDSRGPPFDAEDLDDDNDELDEDEDDDLDEDEDEDEDENETEDLDDDLDDENKTKENRKGLGKPVSNETEPAEGNGSKDRKKESNATKLTGIPRAMQMITRAQLRLEAAGKVAPGHQVALRVLALASQRAQDANQTLDERIALKLARDAERLANRAGKLNRKNLESIINQSELRERIKEKKEKLRGINATELEDVLRGRDINASALRSEIKVMTQEFRALVKNVMENGTVEEQKLLREQLRSMAQQFRNGPARKINEMKKEKIRELLDNNGTAEEIISEAS